MAGRSAGRQFKIRTVDLTPVNVISNQMTTYICIGPGTSSPLTEYGRGWDQPNGTEDHAGKHRPLLKGVVMAQVVKGKVTSSKPHAFKRHVLNGLIAFI